MTMKTSPAGLDIIKKFEGFRAKPYRCPAGVATIGYGSTYYADGKPVKLTDAPITEAQAQELLQATLAKYEACVNGAVKMPINQNQFDAFVSFTYNLGCGAFRKSTMLQLFNTGYAGAAAEQFAKWNRGGGRVLPGLVARRAAEKALFVKGVP